MLDIDITQLPTSDELPCSDETPVDNEDQNWLPNLLLFVLEYLWKDRQDWFFAVDMGVYHTTGEDHRVPIVPDGFLSLGVERRKGGRSRNSYVTWEENGVPPILALEMVSQTPGGEYGSKMDIYAGLGVLYYVIYNPNFWRRDKHLPFEVYKLVGKDYQLQSGEPFWMPEIGLGLGRCTLPTDPINREALGWFDSQGQRHLTPAELADQSQRRVEQEQQQVIAERQRAEQERQRAERLAEKLRELGVDPDTL